MRNKFRRFRRFWYGPLHMIRWYVCIAAVLAGFAATASQAPASASPMSICTNGGCDSGGLRCYFGLYHELICI